MQNTIIIKKITTNTSNKIRVPGARLSEGGEKIVERKKTSLLLRKGYSALNIHDQTI